MADLIDTARIHQNIEIIDGEIADLQEKQAATQIAITNRILQRTRLSDFLTMAEEYITFKPETPPVETLPVETLPVETLPDIDTVKPVADPPVADQPVADQGRLPNKLIRDPDKFQTRLANILVDGYEPGTVITLAELVDKTGYLIPRDITIPRGHWLGSYLTREMHFTGGILEKAGKKEYRVRPDAETILREGIAKFTC